MHDVYRRFVQDRHKVWEARQAGLPAPWTEDPILAGKKFTNVFRVLDHGSQFLVKNLLEGDREDVLLRCFLYRHTNRPDAWEVFHALYGRFPTVTDLATDAVLSTWDLWTQQGGLLFSTAYRIQVGMSNPGVRKLDYVVNLAKRVFLHQEFFRTKDFFEAPPAAQHEMLTRIPRVGDFLAMQILTDWHYSDHGWDMERTFVKPGPGAIKGAKVLALGEDPTSLISDLTRMWAEEENAPRIQLENGSWRAPSLMDVQNTLCEFFKYARELSRPRTYEPYVPKHTATKPVFPAHWKGTE